MARHITKSHFEKLWKAAKRLFVKKETGKGLSSNDFDNTSKSKLDGIEEGAQKNTINGIKANGTALAVDGEGFVELPAAEAVALEEATDEEIDAILNDTSED